MFFSKLRSHQTLLSITDLPQLLGFLQTQKLWKRVDPKIVQIIFTNANSQLTNFTLGALGDTAIEKIISFICFTEEYRCFDNKFCSFIHSFDATNASTRMSQRLRSNGDNYLYSMENGSITEARMKEFGTIAEISLKHAILCDPLNLSVHLTLAALYLAFDMPNSAEEMCKLYDSAELVLLHSKEDPINYGHDVLRRNVSSLLANARNEIDRIKMEVGLQVIEREVVPEATEDAQTKEWTSRIVEENMHKHYRKWASSEIAKDEKQRGA